MKLHLYNYYSLYNSARTDNFTSDELNQYAKDMTTEQDIINQIAYSRELGKIEGKKEGREEGRAEGIGIGMERGIEETAKRMKSDNLDIELICSYTGLTAEAIMAL